MDIWGVVELKGHPPVFRDQPTDKSCLVSFQNISIHMLLSFLPISWSKTPSTNLDYCASLHKKLPVSSLPASNLISMQQSKWQFKKLSPDSFYPPLSTQHLTRTMPHALNIYFEGIKNLNWDRSSLGRAMDVCQDNSISTNLESGTKFSGEWRNSR